MADGRRLPDKDAQHCYATANEAAPKRSRSTFRKLSMKSSKEKPLRVGRAEDSELVIADATVSREHCRLWVEGGTWRVKASA